MSTQNTTRYRCWCEQCDWEQIVWGQERASRMMHLGHGVATGHAETYREEYTDDE